MSRGFAPSTDDLEAVVAQLGTDNQHLTQQNRQLSQQLRELETRLRTHVSLSGLQEFSVQRIAEATHNFSAQSRVGEGGFGAVYRVSGVAPFMVAAKVLAADSLQGEDEFKNEIQLLNRLQHPNVVSLVGYAADAKTKIILTPFYELGSLQAALEAKSHLEFTALLRVAACMDVAKGMLYLHTGLSTPLLHLDLKPDNVLFDGERWKLIDFGLARKIGELKQSGLTHVSSSRIFGTPGYVANEFNDRGHMSAACDMYSFGVLLLVTVTGAKPYANREHLRETVEDALEDITPEEPMPASMRALQTRSCHWRFPRGASLFTALLQLGIRCSNYRRKKRPSFAEVVQVLGKQHADLQAAMAEVKECLVCMDAARTHVLQPCGHAVACEACSRALHMSHAPCPVCRSPITALSAAVEPVTRTFMRPRS